MMAMWERTKIKRPGADRYFLQQTSTSIPILFQTSGLVMADYITNKVSEERQRWTARDSRSPIENGLDMLRLLEYPQLLGKTYLDHAGTTVRHEV